MKNANDELFIIIVTYNGMAWLKPCLESCEGYKIVVVDNNSSDDTVAYIEKHYPEVKLFPQQKNLGFGQANNLGISYALKQGADYVYLLNQDAYLGEGCLESLLTAHKQNPEYGVLSPIHTNAEKNRLDRGFSNYLSYDLNRDFFSDFVLDNSKKEVYEVPFVNAAGWLIPKKCLQTVGGFDPIFFHYGEDDNYCQRVRYHRFKIGVVPTSFMVHDREERKETVIKKGTHKYYTNLEKRLKVHYGDVNFSRIGDFEKIIRRAKNDIVKQSLLLKTNNANHHRHLLQIYKNVLKEIKESVEKNRMEGPLYLN